MSFDVFISHSSKDSAIAHGACAALENAGHSCWISPRNIMPGQDYGEAIVEGIRNCRVFLLIFSGSSVDSPQVRRETERAVNAGLALLPFRIEDVQPSRSLEYFISSAHWLDALTKPMEPHYDYLVAAVDRLLNPETPALGRQLTAPPRLMPARRRGSNLLALVLVGLGGVAAIAAVSLYTRHRAPGRECSAVLDVSTTMFVARATPARSDKPLWLRARPSPESRRITAIGPDEIFRIAPVAAGQWWPAQLCDGTSGFVASRFVAVLDRPGQSAAAANAQ
jgi:hypothetical protein